MTWPDELKCARSDVLDAFAALEIAIMDLMSIQGIEFAGRGTLQQKLERLSELKASPKLSKVRCSALLEYCTEAMNLLPVRNDLVHAKCRLISAEPAIALYQNASRTWPDSTSVRCLSLEDHRRLREQVEHIATGLGPNPPSPPQPKPAAAGDP